MPSYEAIMNELVEVLQFADRLSANLEGVTADDYEGLVDFAGRIRATITELYGEDYEKATTIINNATKIPNDILSEEDKTTKRTQIEMAIDGVFADTSSDLINTIKVLLFGVSSDASGAENGI